MLSTNIVKNETQKQSQFEHEPTSSKSLHANLLHRARLLLAELTAFQSYLQSQRKEDTVRIRQFFLGVQSETKSLERIANIISNEGLIADDKNDAVEARRLHVLQSSNLPFYEVVWQVAIRCEGVLALGMRNRRVRSVSLANEKDSPNHNPVSLGQAGIASKTGTVVKRKDATAADIVADDGGTWIKVSTITEKRLLFEMAKEGWEGYDDESSEDHRDSDVENGTLPGATHCQAHRLELVRLAEGLIKAASAVRVRYRHPRVQFILPKIFEGRLPEIDSVIQDLRKTGVEVQCAAEMQSSFNRQNPTVDSSHSSIFSRMLPRTHPPLSTVLNIDCTILLALISDISHLRSENLPVAPEGKYHSAITRQIKSEETTLLLHSELFPPLVGRQMECTWHAARRMKEIVQTMGTVAEKARADIILGEGEYRELPEAELCARLKDFSDHDVPVGLLLPIRVVDFDADAMLVKDKSEIPAGVMAEVAKGLSEINKGVFLYGWCRFIVTISSNRAVAKEIEKMVCQLLDERERNADEALRDEVTGPNIWVCGTARSLIGKEKGRREG
ncbi:hypothetical protein GJ744_001995 [Endocarpon pusillum]|uniref:DUF1308 domain-containing protein n=1 Tax=Endocarpon pusillum TaxID=364733 RepID=A0A8H7E2Z4_9EURO|nr:hypothetical protein GJ744_001995 [Endocarpon pusillum]